MNYKLLVTELAQSDLDEIISYIAVNLASPIAANDFLDKVAECYGNLRHNPFMYAKSCDLRLEKEGYRKALVGNYIVVFKIIELEKTVVIFRIFYGGSNYFNLL